MYSQTESVPDQPSGWDHAAATAHSLGQLAQDAGQMGVAWAELARAEAGVARASAARLMLGVVLGVVLGFALWLFSCLALGYWVATWLQRTDLAMALVAGMNLMLIVGLVAAMRRWWRAISMPRSRAALGAMAKALS